jgi:hypothetical protein
MSDFKERFGLDYLKSPREDVLSPKNKELLPEGLGDALVAYSGKVMNKLNLIPSHTIRMFDLAREMSTRIDVLLPVVRFMVDRGYVEKISEDPTGNDEIRLTPAGEEIVA